MVSPMEASLACKSQVSSSEVRAMTSDTNARHFFFLLFAGATVLMVLVVRPLATALFLATVLAVVLWPLNQKLTARLGGRPKAAASLLVLGVVLLFGAPLAALSAFVVREGSEGLKFLSTTVQSEGLTELVRKLPGPLEKWATDVIARFPEQWEAWRASGRFADQVATADDAKIDGGKAAAVVGTAAMATGSMLFQAALVLTALYFLLLHGSQLLGWLDRVVPLLHRQTRELLTEFKTVSYAVVVSTVVTCGVQAVAALVGFLIARVPYPLFFAAVTFFVAFIPAIGAASVCLLAAMILFMRDHSYMALFLAIWGIVVVGLVDNLIKPLIIKSGMRMSGAIIFFALLGGLSAFGTAGLVIGPLAVALFLALIRMYMRDFKKPAPAKPSEA